jgi:hypothetical protein
VNGCTAAGFAGCFRCDIKGLGAESSATDEHFAALVPMARAGVRQTLVAVRL